MSRGMDCLVKKVMNHIMLLEDGINQKPMKLCVAGIDFEAWYSEEIQTSGFGAFGRAAYIGYYYIKTESWYAHWRSDRLMQWGGNREKMLRDLTFCRLSGEIEE